MNKLFMSADIGNDRLKAYLDGFQDQLTIPNVTLEMGLKRDTLQDETDILDGLHVSIESAALSKGQNVYAVGKLASYSQLKYEPKPSDLKGEHDQPIIMLLTAIAYEAATRFAGNNVTTKVYLATGLPMREGKGREERLAFKNKLKNTKHIVTFLQTPELEGRTVEIEFGEVLVSTEGFAVYLDMIQDEEGNDRNEELMEGDIVIHDIGGLTTDTAVLREGNVISELCLPLNAGVSTYLDKIIGDVLKEKKYQIASRRELVNIITHRNPTKRNVINNRSAKQNIQDIVDRNLMELAKLQYRHIKETWDRVPGTEYCYVVGGGALVLKPYIEELNGVGEKFELHFLKEEDSVWAIARAYMKMLQGWSEDNVIEFPVPSLAVEE